LASYLSSFKNNELQLLTPFVQAIRFHATFILHMNYLAHAYLSFRNPQWLAGNLVSDYVKGKARFDYTSGVQEGIMLHRAIDDFTDTHPITKETKEIFRPAYRLYAGAFLDVAYDHFLATDTTQFANSAALSEFTQFTYTALQQQYPILPPRFHTLFDRMRQQDWLYNYQFTWGIQKSFEGLVYRAKYLHESQTAFQLFENNYHTILASYQAFFPELHNFATQYVSKLSLC
jgi:acyl carrier protein phosphodiesterase